MSNIVRQPSIIPPNVKREGSRPLSLFAGLDEMEKWMDKFFAHRGLGYLDHLWSEFRGRAEETLPKLDLINKDEEIVVKVAAPGVDKKDLEVRIDDHTLTVKGQVKKEIKEEEGEYFRSEISTKDFARTVYIPFAFDGEKVKAVYENGVLTISLPKLEVAKKREITIE